MEYGAEKGLKKTFVICALCMLLGIAVTRGLSLEHRLLEHPDEHVFYVNTELLLMDVLDEDVYEPVRNYPEGCYVFRLPFQFLARHIYLDPSYNTNVVIWGRIASVFYYSLGCLTALWLVLYALGGGAAGAVIFALSACFSLFQIEISRYGTFDPVSAFTLMAVVLLSTMYIRKGRLIFLAAASAAVGLAAAGKYPLIYFMLLPLGAMLMKEKGGKRKFMLLCLMGASAAAAFLLFSPSVLRDPLFLLRTIRTELGGYVSNGNPEGFSTVPESFFSAIVYQLFYAELPLSGLFALLCALRIGKSGGESVERRFFSLLLPLVLLGFFAYNCLMTTFFFRSLYPFFFLCMPYAAAGLGRLCSGRMMRRAAVLLCALMVLRGSYLVLLLSENRAEGYADSILEQIGEGEIKEVVFLGDIFNSTEIRERTQDLPSYTVEMAALYDNEFPALEEGQLAVVSSMDHGFAKHCVFPPNKQRVIDLMSHWVNFRQENQQYYVGSIYPEHIYYIFGYWLHGSTGTNYEFRNNTVWFRPAE